MQIVKLVLKKSGHHWKMANLSLTPTCLETKSFDLDAVDNRIKNGIIRAAEVFGIIEIVDVSGSPEMSVHLPEEAVSSEPDPVATITLAPLPIPEKTKTPKQLVVTEENRENAKLILKNTIATIKQIVATYPPTHTTREILLGLIEEEKKGKNRVTLLSSLEELFLSIPPEKE